MRKWLAVASIVAVGGFSVPSVFAIQSGTDLIVPAAGSGPGVAPAQWVTSLYLLNPGSASVEVSIAWLVRDSANPNPLTVTRTIPAGSALILDDAIFDLFGISAGNGAFRVTAATAVVANAAIFNRAEGKEFGQGFEGIPTGSATAAGTTTHSVGIGSGGGYRTNFYAVDATGSGSTVLVEVLDGQGTVQGQQTYDLGSYEPKLLNVNTLTSATITGGMVRFTVSAGAAVVGCSRVNGGTGDPLTLSSWQAPAASGGGSGYAPDSLVGLSLNLSVSPNECGQAPFTWPVSVQVTSATEASIVINNGTPMTISPGTYMAGGNLGYVETSVPDWQITNISMVLIWTSASAGRFTGAATDYDGSPIQIAGTFAVVP